MGIYVKGKIRGEGSEEEVEFFVNSGTELVLIPKEIAGRIKPKLVGKAELTLADGSRVSREVYEVKLEVVDSEGKRRSCIVHAAIESIDEPVISFEALDKLNALIDVRERKVIFK